MKLVNAHDDDLELPAGFEPTVSELQSLALPLGYGSKPRNYSEVGPKRKGKTIRSSIPFFMAIFI